MKRINPRGNGDHENFINTRVTLVTYTQCQKNHAETVGEHIVDGCQEYIPSAEEEGPNPTHICAACGCHRSFHRRIVTEVPEQQPQPEQEPQPQPQGDLQ